MNFPIPNLLAFGFASPALLSWLALAAVPVLIHWLFRRRYRETPWAAMRFLHEAARKQSRRARLEQFLLLAARVLVLVVIVLALARPQWAGSGLATAAAPPTLRVLVIDSSLSMQRLTRGERQTMFEAARHAARKIVRAANRGDRLALARIAGSEPRVVISEPTINGSVLLSELDRLEPTWERGDLAATLLALPEVLRGRREAERAEVVLISDFQTDNWSLSNSMKSAWQEIIDRAEIALLDLGESASHNVAVQSLSTSPPLLLAEQPMTAVATIRNTDRTTLTNRRVDLLLDGQLLQSKSVDVPAGQDVPIQFALDAPASGDHELSVRLPDDALLADNVRWQALRVRSHLSVLLVNGRTAGHPRDAATFFVEQALSPRRNRQTPDRGDSANRWLRVETVSDADWLHRDLSREDVVFLCDVGSLAKIEVERLRQFISSGGGVIMSLGPTLKLTDANDAAFGSLGLLPIRLLGQVTANADNAQPFFSFDPAADAHPLLSAFRGNPGAGLETALIREYVRAAVLDTPGIARSDLPMPEPHDEPSASVEVALRFSNGDPAILTQSQGAGRCILLTTSVDETWGAWAIWAPGFVPLMHELIDDAASGGSQFREHIVGEPVVIRLPGTTGTSGAVLTRPNGEPLRLGTAMIGEQSFASVRETLRPGMYAVKIEDSPEWSDQFAVNVDPRESDSQRLSAEELLPSTTQPSRVSVRDADNPLPARAEAIDETTSDLAGRFLMAVMALLLIEQCLAWRSVWGIVSAVVLVAFAVAWQIESWAAGALIVSGIVLATAIWRIRRHVSPTGRAAAR